MGIHEALSNSRLGFLTYAPESELSGGIKTLFRHLKIAFPQLEVFPLPSWLADHPLGKLHFKRWYLTQLRNALISSHFIAKLHQERSFDLFITHSPLGLFLNAQKLKRPVIHIHVGCFKELARRALKNQRDILKENLLIAALDKKSGRGKHGVAISASVQEEIRKVYGYSVEVIPLGVDLKPALHENKLQARQKLGLPKEASVALFIGRAEYAKGWDIVLKTAGELPDVLFLCETEGEIPPSHRENLITRKNSSREALYTSLNAADFFFLPSRYEAGSYATLEAMGLNRPVVISEAVGSAIFATPQKLGPREGVTIVKNESPDYSKAIRTCLDNQEPPQTRRFVETYHSLESFCQNYRNLVARLLQRI